MSKLDFQDNLFLFTETACEMHHITGLFIMKKPKGAPASYVSDVVNELRVAPPVANSYRKKLKYPEGSMQQEWVDDPDLDMDYHFRYYRLPSPGTEEELMRLANVIHGTRLDRFRPLWEYHVIDGIAGGRFAILGKQHHAALDGAAAIRLMNTFFSDNPDENEVIPPWLAPDRKKKSSGKQPEDKSIRDIWKKGSSTLADLSKVFREQFDKATHGHYNTSRLLLSAPRTAINGSLGMARRTYMTNISLEKLRKLEHKYDCTINDIFLCISGGALRAYLGNRDELPGESLVALVPVALQTRSADSGNQLAAIHSPLGTDIADPVERLHMIRDIMDDEKEMFKSISADAARLYTNIFSLPSIGLLLSGLASKVRPTYNLTVSNVAGPSTARYLRGAKLERFVPMSIVTDGSPINVTGISYDGQLQIAVLVCPTSIPQSETIVTLIQDELSRL